MAEPPIFSATGNLLPYEIKLIEDVEKGKDFARHVEREAVIRGGLIRAIFLGTRLANHPRGRGQSVALTSHGVRIVGPAVGTRARPLIRIAGAFDLAGLAAADGGALPRLALENCLVDRPLEFRGVHLHSLLLDGTRFSKLDATDGRFAGSVSIRNCGPKSGPETEDERVFLSRILVAEAGQLDRYRFDEEPTAERADGCACALCAPGEATAKSGAGAGCEFCCDIDFETAEIGGNLTILRTYLRGPQLIGRAYTRPKVADQFGAMLDGLRVRGGIWFEMTTVVGRVSLVSAQIGEDIRFVGGRFVASAERATINLQQATITGGLFIKAFEPGRSDEQREGARAYPIVVVGAVSAVGLRASDVWIAEGFYFAHDPVGRGGQATLNFAKSDVSRTLKIGSYHAFQDEDRRIGSAKVHGEICLTAANLGKNLEVHGVTYADIPNTLDLGHAFYAAFGVDADETPHLRLSGHGLRVDRRVHVSRGSFRNAAERDRSIGRKEAAVDLWKSTFGTGLRLEPQAECIGAIRLNGCAVGRELMIRCSRIGRQDDPEVGATPVPDAIPRVLDLSETAVDGHVTIGRKREAVRASHDVVDGAPDPMNVIGAMVLTSLSVTGDLLIGNVRFNLAGFDGGPGVAARDRFIGNVRTNPGGKAGPEVGARTAGEAGRVAIDLRGASCGSALQITALEWALPQRTDAEDYASGHHRYAYDWLIPCREQLRIMPTDDARAAIVDLRGFRCGMLSDEFGRGWGFGFGIRIRLSGLKVGSVELSSAASGSPEETRLRWLAHQFRRQQVSGGNGSREPNARAPGFWERHYCVTDEEFVPQAYEEFSSSYRRAGEDEAALRILIDRKDVEGTLRVRRLRANLYRFLPLATIGGVIALAWILALAVGVVSFNGLNGSTLIVGAVSILVFAWPFAVAAFQILFKWLFRYGLSVHRGMSTFLALVLVGWIAFHHAQHGQIQPQSARTEAYAHGGELREEVALVLDVPHAPRQPQAGGTGRIETEAVGTLATPCTLDVHALLYALDVFIPLLDLDQERRCSIREVREGEPDRYLGWRAFKAVYEILGWVVTSLLLLTISGVLRRDLER